MPKNETPEQKAERIRKFKEGHEKWKKEGSKKKKVKNEIPLETLKDAVRNSEGYLSYAAERLQCPVETVKMYLKKYKQLREILFEVRERNLDIVEDTLMWRITEKKDVLATMFYLKCMGKHRGWIDKPEKNGSGDKNITIKIVPAPGLALNDGGNGKGSPKKEFQSVNILPALSEKIVDQFIHTKEDDIIEGELAS